MTLSLRRTCSCSPRSRCTLRMRRPRPAPSPPRRERRLLMDSDVVFAAVYAAVVVFAAIGIDTVGERSARRRPGAPGEPTVSWPHTGSVAVHTVVAAVAATAGLLVA